MLGFWIGLAVMAAVMLLIMVLEERQAGFMNPRVSIAERLRNAKAAQRAEQAAQDAAKIAAAERRAFQQEREFQRSIGEDNAPLLSSAKAAVRLVQGSEAARGGWLGDVDFTADIHGITENFQKARALLRTAAELSMLSNPSPDDRRIMDEAMLTASNLELAARDRLKLIEQCATEAKLIDQSLHMEREAAQTEGQRAELHAKLTSMLYGVQAEPAVADTPSVADSVIMRVRAYHEIRSQIQQSRGG
jgi:hypothetical protein